MWFPLGAYWRSDDFIAVHYATDLSRVLSDFAGNQYGLPGMVWFWRPLITLSFWIDGVVAWRNPDAWNVVSHASNVIAHAISTILLARIVARFFGARHAFCAAALWCVMPAHAGSILWAVGRVDGHTTVWILLCALCVLRWRDGMQRTRACALMAQVLALGSKELALVIPGIVLVLCAATAPRGARVRAAISGAWPFVLVTVLYLAWRLVLFGRVLGGYEGATPAAGALLAGLGVWTLQLVNPLMTWHSWCAIGLLSALAAVARMLRARRGAALSACVALFVGCAVPLYQFLPQTGVPLNARLFYLPLAALAPVLAFQRWWIVLVFALPLLLARAEFTDVLRLGDGTCPTSAHANIRASARPLPAGVVFVHGLERMSRDELAPAFHLGVDRLLAPPFAYGGQRALALRPLSGAFDGIDYETKTVSHPFGPTLRVVERGIETRAPAASAATLRATLDGDAHLTSQLFWDLHERRTRRDFVMHERRAPFYRLTIFTAAGYITAICADEAEAGAKDGRVAVATWLKSACGKGSNDARVALALTAPCTLDLETRFPLWIEAGSRPEPFARTHMTTEPLWVTFDRDYAEWAAGRVPDRAR